MNTGQKMVQIFVDMDGVLADFDQHHEAVTGVRPDKKLDNVDWKKVSETPNFYAGIPPMRDMHTLWTFVKRCHPNPIVLTGVPSSIEEACENKKSWIRRKLGPQVEVKCTRSSEKFKHCEPGDILIDDWTKYKKKWEEAGGIFVVHTNALSTVVKLTKLIRDRQCPWQG